MARIANPLIRWFKSSPMLQLMEVWSSLVYGNGLENRRGSDTTVSSNLTASASFETAHRELQ